MDRPATPGVMADLRIEEEPRPEDIALLNDRLYRFNASVTGELPGWPGRTTRVVFRKPLEP